MHPVGTIQAPLGIHEQGPTETCFRDVLSSRLAALEGHHQYLDIELVQPNTRALQLQHVSATGQSKQMSVQHEEEPPATVVLEPMLAVVHIR